MNHTKLITAAITIAISSSATAWQTESNFNYAVKGTTASIVQPGLPHSKERVVYTHKNVVLSEPVKQANYQAVSNEYWETVTGAQLKKGVRLYHHKDKALLRIAPKSKQGILATGLSSELFSLASNKGKPQQIQVLAEQEAMMQAGFNDGSIALYVNVDSPEPTILSTKQALNNNDEYLIHIKEKDSDVILAVDAANYFEQNNTNTLNMNANVNGRALHSKLTTARLLTPTSEVQPAKYTSQGIYFEQPLEHVGAYQGFYDVELTTTAIIDGRQVKRTIKTPFVNVSKTAALEGTVGYVKSNSTLTAILPLNIAEPGRYAVLATLEHTDKTGSTELIETVEVAQWLEQDSKIKVPFNVANTLNGDFRLRSVKLTDQSRMMVLAHLDMM